MTAATAGGAAVLLAALGGGGAFGQTEGPVRLHRLPPPPATAAAPWSDLPIAVLRGLDKASGAVSTFEVAVGATAPFGRLEVTVEACRVSPDGREATARLAIVDRRDDGAVVFSGWMFAGSPALSALDHARYDVWTLACRTASGSSS